MSDDAFLAEIIANPDDDTPRLIYADWLEEQGDPRSEFIRVQVERAALPYYDPRQYELKEREEQFKESHLRGWSQRINKYCQRNEYHRGFVEKITIGLSEAMDRIPRIQKLTPLRAVQFTQTSKGRMSLVANSDILLALRELLFHHEQLGVKVIRELALSPNLANIESLSLVDCALNHASLKELSRASSLTGLKKLFLFANRIEERGLEHLSQAGFMAQLEELTIDCSSLDNEALVRFFREIDWRTLKFLSLSSLPADFIIPGSSTLPNLKTLHLTGQQRGSMLLDQLVGNDLLEQLEEFVINLYRDGDVDSQLSLFDSMESRDLSNLQYFCCYINGYRPTNLYRVMEADWFANLMNFNFSGRLNDPEATVLAGSAALRSQRGVRFDPSVELYRLIRLLKSPHAVNLREIDLTGGRLTGEKFGKLAVPQLSQMKTINLFGNPIGDAGLELLMETDRFPHLSALNIGRIGATNPGWMAFFQPQNQLKLKKLDLSFNALNAAAVDALLTWPGVEHIEALTVYPNVIASADLERIELKLGSRLQLLT